MPLPRLLEEEERLVRRFSADFRKGFHICFLGGGDDFVLIKLQRQRRARENLKFASDLNRSSAPAAVRPNMLQALAASASLGTLQYFTIRSSNPAVHAATALELGATAAWHADGARYAV